MPSAPAKETALPPFVRLNFSPPRGRYTIALFSIIHHVPIRSSPWLFLLYLNRQAVASSLEYPLRPYPLKTPNPGSLIRGFSTVLI